MDPYKVPLKDRDLAYLPEQTPEFKDYIRDLLSAQDRYGNPLWKEHVDHTQRRIQMKEGQLGVIPGAFRVPLVRP